jgi:hypothetical protein
MEIYRKGKISMSTSRCRGLVSGGKSFMRTGSYRVPRSSSCWNTSLKIERRALQKMPPQNSQFNSKCSLVLRKLLRRFARL